jgi:hypothetical protein
LTKCDIAKHSTKVCTQIMKIMVQFWWPSEPLKIIHTRENTFVFQGLGNWVCETT